MNFADTDIPTIIPTKIVGPIRIEQLETGITEDIMVPMATLETPLWYSTQRGALVSQKSGGIKTAILQDIMTRSIILESSDTASAKDCGNWISNNKDAIAKIIERSSQHAKLENIHLEIVSKLIFVHFSINVRNASGHNMVTKAADDAAAFIIQNFCHPNPNQDNQAASKIEGLDDNPQRLKYISVSGNYCVDKKVSAINGILGRGKRVCAEIIVKKDICESILKTTPQKICELNLKKNMLGSVLAGSVRSANAHYANTVLAIFLATGQDAANIIEASQGITFAEIIDSTADTIAKTTREDLYFSVTIPNIIAGTVGNGKNLDFARKNLEIMGCNKEDPDSSKRLASIIASAVLCSELSLMAALTNAGELMKAHIYLERNTKK